MNKILFVNACARENSRTLELAKQVMGDLSGTVEEMNLYETSLSPLDRERLEKREADCKKQDYSDKSYDMAKQFAAADTIVIAAPYWDLSFPAVLKMYLEAVSVSGLTFRYSQEGFPIGLCQAKDLYYVTTAGGYIGDNNFGYTYVKTLAQLMYGIPNIHFTSREGLDIV